MDEGRSRDFLARGRELERNVESKKRNGESRDVIKNLKNAGTKKGRMNAGKKCGESKGQKETEIIAKGMKKLKGSIVRIGEENGDRNEGKVMGKR